MSISAPKEPSAEEKFRNTLSNSFAKLNLTPLDPMAQTYREPGRRAFRYDPRRLSESPQVATLVRRDGLLRWEFDAGAGRIASLSTRRAGRAALIPGEIVHQFEFEELPPNQVVEAITWLDRKLTPAAWLGHSGPLHGLRHLRNGEQDEYVLDAKSLSDKKLFVLIHGTASHCAKLIEDVKSTTPGKEFLTALAKSRRYDAVLTFDHPTLSVSPMINAVDLAALLRIPPGTKPPKQIDIVCHSRGGLVARWFCEAFAEPATRHRALFVGSPLAGTSLAAPANLKKALDFVTNVTEMLEKAADTFSAAPFVALAGALLKIFNIVARLTSKTPLPDVVLQLVPGLAAQQRVGNNAEIDRLRRYTGNSIPTGPGLEYFAVKSNFEPTDLGWNPLGYFSKPLQRVFNASADLIFQTENDLVVDTRGMNELADRTSLPDKNVHDFGTSATVHHTNYFRQRETVEFIRRSYDI